MQEIFFYLIHNNMMPLFTKVAIVLFVYAVKEVIDIQLLLKK
jgi:hypothetical protein